MCTPKSKDQLRKEEFLQQAKDIAIERGGKCLSTEYVNNKIKMLWECKNKHKWYSTYDKVINANRWCPNCGGTKKKTIEDCHILAKSKNGKCLSIEYANNKTKMLWECKNKHKWYSTLNDIIMGHWCSACLGLKRKTIEDCHILAKSKDGKCISNKYTNTKTKLLWECKNKHKWYSTLNDISNNKWCPHCKNKNESKCREIFNRLTDVQFLSKRPKWLMNITNKRMQFDGYNEYYKIAFEYQGQQHYNYIPLFHKNGNEDLIKQQNRDKLKEQLAKEHGVRLIIIPYYVDDLEAFIYEELMKIDPSLIKLNLDELIKVEESSDVL